MKRLMALLGFTSFAVLLAVLFFGISSAPYIALISVMLFAVSMLIPRVRRDKTIPVAFAAAFVAVMWIFAYTNIMILPVFDAYSGQSADICVEQLRPVYTLNGYYCYEGKILEADGKGVNSKIIIHSEDYIPSEPYDKLIFRCDLRGTQYSSNLSKGIYLETYIFEDHPVTVTADSNKPPMYYVQKLNGALRQGLFMELDKDAAAFSSAMLLGDKYSVDSEVKELFRASGISHITVVSGLHLSVIAFVVKSLLDRVINKRWISGVVTIGCLILFAALTGFGFSVMRALVLQSVFIAGGLFKRKSDSLNFLGLAALFILIPSPYAAGDIGMQLSFLSTLGIILWSNKITAFIMERLSKIKFASKVESFVNAFSASLCASVWTFPVTIFVFGSVSTAGLAINMVVVPLLTPLIVLVMLCSVTHYIAFLPFIADSIAVVINLAYDALIFLCRFMTGLPYSYLRIDDAYFVLWLCSSILLLAIANIFGKKRAYILAVLCSVMILLVSSSCFNVSKENTLLLKFTDTGRGYSLIAETASDYVVLAGNGSREKVYLLEKELSYMKSSAGNLYINSGGKYSDIYEEKIRSLFDYNHILRYDKDISKIEYCDDGGSAYYETLSVTLRDNVKLELISGKECLYEYLLAGDKEVLILTDNADIAEIPLDFRSPDILIARCVPDNLHLLRIHTLIVPGEDYTAHAVAEVCAPVCREIIVGADKYKIDLKS